MRKAGFRFRYTAISKLMEQMLKNIVCCLCFESWKKSVIVWRTMRMRKSTRRKPVRKKIVLKIRLHSQTIRRKCLFFLQNNLM